jgi:uncharacterized protein YukE
VTVNPLVAGGIDQPNSAWAGVWIAEDIELIAQGVRGRSWVDGSLGVVGAGLDGLALVSDPVGALLQYGISWLIEHVRPLSEALDWLAGDPGRIAGHAQTWRNVASSLRDESDVLGRSVRLDLSEWQGAASEAYRGWADRRDQSLLALARASETMALITEGAGMLIGTVRIMVRDAVATVVSRLIVYAGELVASFGLATPLVVEQVSSLCASWAAKISRWLRDLISSIRNLMGESDKLANLIETLRSRPGHASESEGGEPHKGPDSEQATEATTHSGEPQPPDFTDLDLDPTKIAGYVMNPDHPVGTNKYRVIHSVTGLDVGDAAAVEQQVRDGVRNGSPVPGLLDQYGQRWTVDVPLTGPNGSIIVRSAWIVDVGQARPRLVTISFPKEE